LYNLAPPGLPPADSASYSSPLLPGQTVRAYRLTGEAAGTAALAANPAHPGIKICTVLFAISFGGRNTTGYCSSHYCFSVYGYAPT
jgi:hypothetical protein